MAGLPHPRLKLTEHVPVQDKQAEIHMSTAIHGSFKQVNSPATVGSFLEDWLLEVLDR